MGGAGLTSPEVEETERAMHGGDLHSFSRPDEVVVRHLGLDWTVSFEERRLAGSATLWVERHDPTAPLRLDTRALDIERVEVGTRPAAAALRLARVEGVAWAPAAHSLGPVDPILGRSLAVELPAGADLVRIHYRTSPAASGLQWLSPAQTADGTDPFLYSQSQAIHARSWIPCQDSPGVRVTYDAVVVVPQGEGTEDRVALMSARRVEPAALAQAPAPGEHVFEMPQPIPAYLVALAVGRVEFEPLGERSGVWAEPSVRPLAAREFADVERMMAVTESLYGPYRWERYDVLVLPPAFPFGGMENPRLTFATPTILAGDRSLVSLVAHELAHSWSGNLVTNATWEDLWLNEGFTVYIERRIVEALYGPGRAEMEAMLGRQDLDEELAGLRHPGDSKLHVDLRGRDPDEGLSDVAYEKGALFLLELEESYGREAFDPFVRKWFDAHAFTSVDGPEFEAFLERELVSVAEPRPGKQAARPDAWIRGEGVPEGAPRPRSDAFAEVDAAIVELAGGRLRATGLPTKGWTPHQWLHFLRGLPADLPARVLGELDDAFALTRSGNAEILAQWLEVAVLRGYAPADARLEQFLRTVGRRKFLEPLYTALLTAGRKADAVRIYGQARAGYHPITQHTLDRLLAG